MHRLAIEPYKYKFTFRFITIINLTFFTFVNLGSYISLLIL